MTAREFAEQICRALRGAGYQAYLVGGCVRDILLGREPADYDVATDATPDDVMRIFPESYAVGARFGVVLVPVSSAATVVEPSSEHLNHRGHAGHRGTVEVATF